MPDQRALLLGRLASAIDGVADVASRLGPPRLRQRPPRHRRHRSSRSAARGPLRRRWSRLPRRLSRAARNRGDPSIATPEPPPPLEHHRSRIPLAVIGSSFLVLVLIAAIAGRLIGAGAPVQAPARPTQQISLTGVRPVASAPAGAGTLPATQVSFPARTSVVDIEVNSGGAAGQAPVHIVVTLGQPEQTVIQNDYVLSQSGATVIPLTPPGSNFAPGEYEVTITYKGALLGSTAFAVH